MNHAKQQEKKIKANHRWICWPFFWSKLSTPSAFEKSTCSAEV